LIIINRTDRYRLEALLELGWAYPNAIPVAEIARRRQIPQAYLSRLLGELTRAGWLRSRRGPGGGVALVEPPETVQLNQLLRLDLESSHGSPAVRRLSELISGRMRQTLCDLNLAELVSWERQSQTKPEYII